LSFLVVIFAAWHVVKAFNRMRPPMPRQRPQAQRPQPQPMIEAEDLISCRSCGTYIAASARHCGPGGLPATALTG